MNENNVAATTETVETTQEQEEQAVVEKTFTESEVNSMVDRRVTQALKTQAAKYEKQLSFAKLDEQQRRDAEQQMRIEELEGQVRDFEITKNRSEIKTVLGQRGLPVSFADLINIGSDYDEALKAIDVFDKTFKNAVAEEVKRRLASNAPDAGTTTKTIDFNKMSIVEKQQLYNANPELYKKLAGRS